MSEWKKRLFRGDKSVSAEGKSASEEDLGPTALTIQWTSHPEARFLHYMSIDLRSEDAGMAKQFLYGSNVITRFKQVGCKTMAQGVAAGRLGYSCQAHGIFHRALQPLLVYVMSAHLTAARIA